MADTVVLDQPINAEPSQPPRKPGTFTAQTARKAALASVQARKLKAQRLTEPDIPAPLPLAADVHRNPGLVIASLPRAESALSRIGDETREGLAKALLAQVNLLASKPPSKRDELTGRDGTAQATKTLADAGNVVHGWGEGTVPGIVIMGDVERIRPEDIHRAQVTDCQTAEPTAGQPVIDVEPVPEPKPPLGAGPVEVQAEVVAVGSEPTGAR